ncbi:MAG TPA: AAA family ATPase [Thermoanaerobaculia bacterium]
MYVQEIAIHNLRVFEAASLKLQYPGRSDADALHHPNINLLLGNNGAGKTTVLKALALSTLAPVIDKSGFLPYELVRHGRERSTITAKVVLHPQDLGKGFSTHPHEESLTTEIVRQGDLEILASGIGTDPGPWSGMFDNKSPSFLVVGYGATRRVQDAGSFNPEEQGKRRFLRYQRVAGLFESHIALTPLPAWLPGYQKENPGRYKQVSNLINKLLPEGARFSGRRERADSGDYMFQLHDAEVPFGALSDGYRAYIGWITDLLYHVCMGCPNNTKLVDSRGLVLIDEIDLNLHPEWQRTVCATVSAALPNLQFVLSTHSPIVAGSLQKENIFVMEADASGASRVRQYEERIYGLDADQILLSPYFNLETTRAPGFVDELQQLSKQAAPGKPEISLAIMRKLVGQAAPEERPQRDGGKKKRKLSA